MPVSKLRPPKNVVKNFYRNSGMEQRSTAIAETVEQDTISRTEHLKAHRGAQAARMVSGGLCKSVR